MKIKKIEINSFGKFENFELFLEDDIQVIYGENEAGKSTLMEFIKLLLYSRRKGETTCTEDKLLRSKYSPWSGKNMQGAMEFSWNGCDYRLEKKISNISALKDVTKLYNCSLGELINLGKKEEVGERLFKLDLYSFERSSYISNFANHGFQDIKNSKDSLLNKMFNLSSLEEEEVSGIKVISRIEDAIKQLYTQRGKKGKIQRLEEEIKTLKLEIETAKNIEKEKDVLSKQLTQIESLIKEKQSLETQIDKLSVYNKICALKEVIELVKLKQDCENKVKCIGPENLQDFLNYLETLKSEINLEETKQKELKSKISQNFIPVSEEDLERLNLQTKEQEELKKRLDKVTFFAGLKSIQNIKKEDIQQIYNNKILHLLSEYEKEKNQLETLKTELESLKANQANAEIQSAELQACLKEKIFKYKMVWILVIVFIFSAVAAYIFLSLSNEVASAVAFSLVAVILPTIWNLKTLKPQIASLKEKIHELGKELANPEFEKIKSLILNHEKNMSQSDINAQTILNNQRTELEAHLRNSEAAFKELLSAKNISSVSQYYEAYAKTKTFYENKAELESVNEKIQELKSRFIKDISKYSVAANYEESLGLLDQLHCISKNIHEYQQKISIKLENIGSHTDNLEDLENQLNNLEPQLSSFDFSVSPQDINSLTSRLNELKSMKLSDIKFEIRNKMKVPAKSLAELEKELFEKNSQFRAASEHLKVLNLTNELIQETENEFRKKFNPQLDKLASKIFCKLTSNKYTDVYIKKDYSIEIGKDSIHRNFQNFSSGTIDQAYLALRIALSKLISKEAKVPIFIDDILARYDTKRMKNALEFLKENSKCTQTIIFTCHEKLAQSAHAEGIKVMIL